MPRRSAFSSALSLVGGSVLLAGCSTWSFSPPIHGNYPSDGLNHTKVTADAPAAGGNFVQESAHDYAGLVDMLARSGDRADVDYFARKGIVAEGGAVVPPEDNGNWAIPLEQPFGFRTQMAQARQRLVGDLDNGGRDRFPALAARAQVAYDCWLERTEDDWVHEVDGACHKDFLASIGALEAALKGVPAAALPPAAAPALPSHQYNVYFEFDHADLTPEGRQVVDAVANAAKTDPGVQLRLVGKADLVGTDPYNVALSHHRADTVRAALRSDGIDNSRIQENWVGFHEPPVPTAPGVREPRNRVVEVTLQ
jgi:OOP family OmpA-OmpF porin